MLDHLGSRYSSIGDTIVETGKLEDDLVEQLKKAVEDFKQSWSARVESDAADAAAKTESESE